MDGGQVATRRREVLPTVLLMVLTLGLYGWVWQWQAFGEVREQRGGKGASGLVGTLLGPFLISTFLLPTYIRRMHREAGR